MILVLDFEMWNAPKKKALSGYLKRHFEVLVGAEGVEPPTLCL